MQDPADMRGVILNTKLALDQPRHSRTGRKREAVAHG
jgi:hypothetical protein